MAGIPLSSQNAIDQALFHGRKIEAIKLYRTVAGCDLKEAKDAVERRDGELRTRDPSLFADKKSGCLAVALLTLFCGLAVWALA